MCRDKHGNQEIVLLDISDLYIIKDLMGVKRIGVDVVKFKKLMLAFQFGRRVGKPLVEAFYGFSVWPQTTFGRVSSVAPIDSVLKRIYAGGKAGPYPKVPYFIQCFPWGK